MQSASLIFPHQLYADHPACQPGQPIWLVEEHLFFREYRYHRAKLVFHRASMCAYAEALQSAGFEIRRQGYWNFSIFFPVALVRLAKRLLSRLSTKPSAGDLKPIPFLFNQVLIWLLNMENKILLAGVNFPWGVSATVVARKPPHGVHCVHEYAHGKRFLSPVA